MSKLVSHTPSWLSHPSPGARIFSDPEVQSPASPSKRFKLDDSHGGGPASSPSSTCSRRTIAHRGSEIFTVVGNKIRWADLAQVKDEWERQSRQRSMDSEKKPYCTFKTPVYYQITDISVSPSGVFLAISTEHTVHLAVLPDSSRLRDGDAEIKLKTYQLGPTTHVIPEAPLVAVLWHPLAASSQSTDCLITVTTDSAVRLWEFDRTNHWSFERPMLAIDLRKLADGTSSDQDFEPSAFGRSRGFSADTFDMEASAACFAGRASENEDPWAAMTLWTSMSNGDVYALCPLLPSTWRPASTTIPALATSAVSSIASMSAEHADPDDQRAANQRYEWVQELDNEDFGLGNPADASIRSRPSNPSAIPRLQGPFQLPLDEIDHTAEVTDILVIPANLDEDDVFSGEDDYEFLSGSKSLPFTIVCLTTSENQLHLMIELEGVTGQWLPKKGRSHFSVPTWDAGEFILVDTVSLEGEIQSQTIRPAFTIDPANPYRFYVTTAQAVISLSLEEWASRVGFELSENDSDVIDAGLQSRLQLACQGSICVKKVMISLPSNDKAAHLLPSTAALIEDIRLGTLILTSSAGRVVAAQLDQTTSQALQILSGELSQSPIPQPSFRTSQSLFHVLQSDSNNTVDSPPTRAPYAPSRTFYQNQMSSIDHITSQISSHHRSMLTEKPLRLSPACLKVITAAHRTFSARTSVTETAAAELFRRCERLTEELADQVRQLAELGERLNRLDSSIDVENRKSQNSTQTHSEKITARIEAANVRQKDLVNRYERVRRKAGQVGHAKQDLSIKERVWIEEIKSLAQRVGLDPESDIVDDHQAQGQTDVLTSRLSTAKALFEELTVQAKEFKEQNTNEEQSANSDGKVRVRLGGNVGMSRYQRQKISEVMEMVEREAAIIEAVQGRLGKLTVNV